jgi:diadenosine tetraphosphate (Ap4A) HIT family hydrolase
MTADEFKLDPRLAHDTAHVTDWPLSGVHLMNDRRYAWLVLVPRKASMVEPFDLAKADQTQLWREVGRAARLLKTSTQCRKVNIGALGNIVSQLHVHVIARNEGDAAWPGPVWGKGAAERFEHGTLKDEVARYRTLLSPPTD